MIDTAITIVEYIDRFIEHCGNALDWAYDNGIAQDLGRVIGMGIRYTWNEILPFVAKWSILILQKGGYIN